MKRLLWACPLLVAAFGCGICQAPYDYTNAVVGPNCCPNCGFHTRAGSILSGPGAPAGPMGPTPAIAAPTDEESYETEPQYDAGPQHDASPQYDAGPQYESSAPEELPAQPMPMTRRPSIRRMR